MGFSGLVDVRPESLQGRVWWTLVKYGWKLDCEEDTRPGPLTLDLIVAFQLSLGLHTGRLLSRSLYRVLRTLMYNCIPWCFCPNTLRIPCIAITKTRVVRHVCLYPQLRSGLLRVEINDDYFSSTMGDRTRTISSAANLHKRRRPGLFRVKLPIYIIKRTQE